MEFVVDEVWYSFRVEQINTHWGFPVGPASGIVLVIAKAVFDRWVLGENHCRGWRLKGHCVRSHLSNMLTEQLAEIGGPCR